MEYSQVSFNKIMLNIATPQGEGINFNKGEILKGLVQEVKDDGLVMLFIKGKLIEAASEIMVKSGQQLYLMVDEYRDGRTYLKVVTPQMMGEIENTNLSASLRDQGVASSQENLQSARKLLDYNLPVTTSNLNNLSRSTKMLGGYSPRNFEIAGFAMSRDMVLSQSTLTALSRFVSSGTGDVAKLLNDIEQILSVLINADDSIPEAGTPPIPSASNPVRASLAGTVQLPLIIEAEPNLTDQVPRTTMASRSNPDMTVNPSTDGRDQVSGRTADSLIQESQVSKPSVNPLTQASSFVAAPDQNNSEAQPGVQVSTNDLNGKAVPSTPTTMPISADAFITGTDRNIKETLDLVQRLFNSLILKADDAVPENAQKLASRIKSEPDIIKNLQILADIINNTKPEVHSSALKELASRLEGMEKEITGQRLFNIASRLPGDNIINGYYFAIPVQNENELRLCQLKIHRDTKKTLQMQDSIRFIVSLDTKNLGMVLFYVDWKRRGELNLQGVVENKETQQHLNANSGSLIAKLQALGYKVTFSGIKLSQPAEILDLRPALGGKPETAVRPFSIDVIV